MRSSTLTARRQVTCCDRSDATPTSTSIVDRRCHCGVCRLRQSHQPDSASPGHIAGIHANAECDRHVGAAPPAWRRGSIDNVGTDPIRVRCHRNYVHNHADLRCERNCPRNNPRNNLHVRLDQREPTAGRRTRPLVSVHDIINERHVGCIEWVDDGSDLESGFVLPAGILRFLHIDETIASGSEACDSI
jgi:hypothetical protein